MPDRLRFSRHARRRMALRQITEAEAEEVWTTRQIVSREPARPPHEGYVLVIRGRTSAGRRLKVVVSEAAPDLVVTLADADVEDNR